MSEIPAKDKAEAVGQDKETFWELLESHEKKLFNFLRRSLQFSEDSADLYQEVVLRAWKYFTTFDRSRSFPAWLFAIAHNEVKSYYRRCRGSRVVPLAQLAGDPAAPAADPVVLLIQEAAGRLPPRQREVFYLYYYNGFSVTEVAAICGLSRGNVKFILNRGRAAVREALEVSHER